MTPSETIWTLIAAVLTVAFLIAAATAVWALSGLRHQAHGDFELDDEGDDE